MTTRFNKSLLLLSTAASLGIAVPATAWAQSADNSGNVVQQIEQVVVTATRREERLQDVPISISVFNQQQLANHNVVNSQDLAAFTPSLSANNNFGSQNTSFAIRGFVQETGTAPSVGVFFDDVVAPRGASNGIPVGDGAGPGSFFDLKNVQVLKGPQGTLFGRNTTGGDILLVPNKPTAQFGGYVQGSFGNYNMRGGQAVLNIPLNDKMRLRLGIDHMSRDGYLKNTGAIGPKRFDDVNYTTGRIGFDVDITPNLENYTLATYTDSSTNGDFQKLIACSNYSLGSFACGQLATQGSDFYDAQQSLPNPHSVLKVWRIINTTTWQVSDHLTIKNIASYAQLKDVDATPIFGTNFYSPAISALGLPAYSFDFAASVPVPNGATANQSTYTEELQLQGNNLNNRLTWQAGFYMEGSEPLAVVGSQSPVAATCTNSYQFQCNDILGLLGYLGASALNPLATYTPAGVINLTEGRTTYRDYAAYAQASYKLTNEFKITAGFRYTEDLEEATSTQVTYLLNPNLNIPLAYAPGPVLVDPTLPFFAPLSAGTWGHTCTNPLETAPCTTHFKLKTHAPTWMVDLDYTPNDHTLVYAKYTRGYRAGTIAPTVSAPFNYVGPEHVDTYELGLKSAFQASSIPVVLDGDFFYNNFSNQQLQLGFDPNPCYQVVGGSCVKAHVGPAAAPVNVGKSRIWGFELQTSVTPVENLTVSLAYTYLNTEITSLTLPTVPAGSLYILDGTQHVGDPLSLSPKNKFNLSVDYTLPLSDNIGRITIGANLTHTDRQLANYSDRAATFPDGTAIPAALQKLSYLGSTNLLGLNLNWTQVMGHPIDLSLFATNVTGEKYYTYIPGLAAAAGLETAAVGAPTMYGVRLKYHFGD